ncbi:hypothetical protein RF55_17237, partial [Lasius niger]
MPQSGKRPNEKMPIMLIYVANIEEYRDKQYFLQQHVLRGKKVLPLLLPEGSE